MSKTFDLSINIYCRKNKDITIDDFFLEILNTSKSVDIITRKINKWYLTGNTKKKSYENIVFEKGIITKESYDIVKNNSIKNEGMINESIWNGKLDGSACSISHYMKFMEDHRKLNIVVDINQHPSDIDITVNEIHNLVKNKNNPWLVVDSKCYWFNDKNVFPDRIYAGWMLYAPHIILPELIPEAARVIPVLDKEKQRGKIIVTTEEFFDGEKKEHIEKANDIEIRLLDLGMLPLMTEL